MRDSDLTSDERKSQLRDAQRTYREKQMTQGRKAQSFVLSKEDHYKMEVIKMIVSEVKSKEQAISYALDQTVKNLENKK
jgi:hypothetical protein